MRFAFLLFLTRPKLTAPSIICVIVLPGSRVKPGMMPAFTSPKRLHVPAESVRTSCRETALMLIAGHSITPFESEPLSNFESAKP